MSKIAIVVFFLSLQAGAQASRIAGHLMKAFKDAAMAFSRHPDLKIYESKQGAIIVEQVRRGDGLIYMEISLPPLSELGQYLNLGKETARATASDAGQITHIVIPSIFVPRGADQ